MAGDNNVEISFGASVGDALDGIAQIRSALSGLTAPIGGIGASLDRLGTSFGTAMPLDLINRDTQGVGALGTAAQGAASASRAAGSAAQEAGGQVKSIGDNVANLQQHFTEQKILLSAEVSQFKITQDQKYFLLEQEAEREFQLRHAALQDSLVAAEKDGQQEGNIIKKINALKAKHATDMVRLDEESIGAQQKLWTGYLSTVTGAFNSQLRGLLEGTTSWHKASVKMLEDLTIKFIEKAEEMVVRWLAGEIAKTTATTTGAAARAEAEQTASSASMLSGIGNTVSAIMRDAAQAFAGVFAFRRL